MNKKSAKKEKPLAEKIKDRVAKEIFDQGNKRPNLAIVVFGDENDLSEKIDKLEKEAKKCGIDTNLYVCEHDSSQSAAEGMIEFLNADDAIDAILVQKPVPKNIDFETLQFFIKGDKEIECDIDMIEKNEKLWQARVFEGVLERYITCNE